MILWEFTTTLGLIFLLLAGLNRDKKPVFYYYLLAGHIWTATAILILAIRYFK